MNHYVVHLKLSNIVNQLYLNFFFFDRKEGFIGGHE